MLLKDSNCCIASTYPHQLFPHHWSAILAENIPGERPEWKTLQYKIQASELDRLYESPDDLIGVRFGSTTKYAVIDIDTHSPYHPAVSKSEWDRLLTTLEDVGLTDQIIVQSSFSRGLHVYLWFPEELPTFEVAQLLWSTFAANGFFMRSGDLETFPNAKVYTPTPSVYAAHRLPLQPNTGSVLLDECLDEMQTVDQQRLFFDRAANPRQDMDLVSKKLVWAAKYFKKHRLQKTGMGTSATEWKRCLDDRLKLGWTGTGQTNEILRTVCVRSWVFGHSSDIDAVHQIVLNIPGYQEYCLHQDEILERLQDWMKCVQKHYYPYGRPELAGGVGDPLSVVPVNVTKRERPRSTVRHDNVVERLRGVVGAIAEGINGAISLPQKIGDLVHLIQEKAKELYGNSFSINTLYNYKYKPEWRILVEMLQSHIQHGSPYVSDIAETTEKEASNPDISSVLPCLSPMKVCFFLRIQLNCAQLLSRVFQICLNSFQTSVEFSTLELPTEIVQNKTEFTTETEIVLVSDRDNLSNEQSLTTLKQHTISTEESRSETDSISFTYVNMPRASEKMLINKTYESQSGSVDLSPLEAVIEPVSVSSVDRLTPDPDNALDPEVCEDDEPSVSVGDYLRRIPVTTGGQYYPELIAQVVREGRFGWELTCAEGKSWRCPFNMLGQSWEVLK